MTVRIIPPDGAEGSLSVEAAMKQVLATFALLNSGGATTVWRLVSASTNSPLTIVAEGENDVVASHQKTVFAQSMRELKMGRYPEAWKRPELQPAANTILSKLIDSLGEMVVDLDDGSGPIVIAQQDAQVFEGLPDAYAPQLTIAVSAKNQVGSIEGLLVEVTTFRGKPAIRLQERKSKRDVTCVIPAELVESLSHIANLRDVWERRRLIVRGTILYQARGSILRVEATDVQIVEFAPRDLRSLRDPDFTAGLSAAEYLEKFRAGELG
jgi:hypothetical protein